MTAARELLGVLLVWLAIAAMLMVGIPAAVQLANVFTPTGVDSYPWWTPALLTMMMRGVPLPAATQACAFGILIAVIVLLALLSAAGLGFHSNGRASILQLRFYVWRKSSPWLQGISWPAPWWKLWLIRGRRRAPLTAKAAVPLGRIGWFGFFGLRWFTDLQEDRRILLAPSGSGKTVRLVVHIILRALGPIVTTSTKPDVLILTGWVRKMRFPFAHVMAFDPEGLVPWMRSWRVKIDMVAGCEDGQMAMKRAAALVAARPLNGSQSSNADFFKQAVTIVLQCMLHAAAVKKLSMEDVMRWMGDFSDDTPYDILRDTPGAIHSWGQLLTKYCRGKADETVSSTDMSASGVLNAFSIKSILDSVCPREGDRVVDLARHHRTRDSLYLICKGEDSPAASVFTALVESMYVLASDDVTRNGRCVPALELVLDEWPNVCAIPSAPKIMSTGRDEGIILTGVAQDYPQIVVRYDESAAKTLVNNTAELIVMGGLKDDEYLERVSALAGSLETLGRGQARRVLAPEKIRTLREGKALLFYRNMLPVIITLPTWWRSKHKHEYEASLTWAKKEQELYAARAQFEDMIRQESAA